MQQSKSTKINGEFQKFIDSDNKTGLCLEETLKFFEIRRIFGKFEAVKQGGIHVTLILTALLVMLFYNARNVHSYFSRQFGKATGIQGSKNPYYDLMGNEYICWRVILYLFAKRYLNLVGQIRGCTVQTRALIFDDSPLGKRGKKIEGVSKVYAMLRETSFLATKYWYAVIGTGAILYRLIFPSTANEEKNWTKHVASAIKRGARPGKPGRRTRNTKYGTISPGQSSLGYGKKK